MGNQNSNKKPVPTPGLCGPRCLMFDAVRSKMRKLVAQGGTPWPDEIPTTNDILAANCIPPNFMVQTGCDIVCDYYMVSGMVSMLGRVPTI